MASLGAGYEISFYNLNYAKLMKQWVDIFSRQRELEDGQIDYGDFAAMMRKGNGSIERTMRRTINLGDVFGVTVNGVNELDSSI